MLNLLNKVPGYTDIEIRIVTPNVLCRCAEAIGEMDEKVYKAGCLRFLTTTTVTRDGYTSYLVRHLSIYRNYAIDMEYM